MAKNRPGVADHGAPPTPFAKRARKLIVGACGLAAQVVSTGILEENAEIVVNSLLAIATAYGIWRVPNAPAQADAVR